MTKIKKEYEMTISEDLFDAWTKLRRKNDPEEIAKLVGRSRPVIDRALKYGHVKDDNVVRGITDFYMRRLAEEAESARKLGGK